MSRYKVLVIGLGSTGSSILYNLVKMGITDVIAIDARCPGCGQTSRSSALIRLHYTHPILRDMAVYSWRFWRRFKEETGYEHEVFHETGIGFAGGDEHLETMKEVVYSLKRMGIDVELYDPDVFRREFYHDLDVSGLTGIAWEPESGYCDAYDSVQGFVNYAVEGGAEIRTKEKVVGFDYEGNEILRVKTDRNVYEVDYVVNASGVWTNEMLRSLGIELPIKLAREDVLYVSQSDKKILFGWGDFCLGFYGRPDGETRYLIGGLEPMYNGFEPEPGEYSYPPIDVVEDRLGRAAKRFPVLDNATPISSIYGFYDVTPDFQPIIGHDTKYRNLLHLVGLSGHGFKLSPAYGLTIAELIRYREARTFDISGLTLQRFSRREEQHSKYKYGIIG